MTSNRESIIALTTTSMVLHYLLHTASIPHHVHTIKKHQYLVVIGCRMQVQQGMEEGGSGKYYVKV